MATQKYAERIILLINNVESITTCFVGKCTPVHISLRLQQRIQLEASHLSCVVSVLRTD